MTPTQQAELIDNLRKIALDTCDDGTGTHTETLWWQAADAIEELMKSILLLSAPESLADISAESCYANPSIEMILQAVPQLQWRRCWDCGRESLHRDNVRPACLCHSCGSQDTRMLTNANKSLHRKG